MSLEQLEEEVDFESEINSVDSSNVPEPEIPQDVLGDYEDGYNDFSEESSWPWMGAGGTRGMPCKNGPSCKFMAMGTCRFDHGEKTETKDWAPPAAAGYWPAEAADYWRAAPAAAPAAPKSVKWNVWTPGAPGAKAQEPSKVPPAASPEEKPRAASRSPRRPARLTAAKGAKLTPAKRHDVDEAKLERPPGVF